MAHCLTVTLRAAPGHEEAVAAGLAELEAASRREPAVIEWRVHRSTDDPRAFLLYELYTDADGLAAHRASAHFARYRDEVLPLVESREVVSWATQG